MTATTAHEATLVTKKRTSSGKFLATEFIVATD